MLKARGLNGFEKAIDHGFFVADYLATELKSHPDFRLIQQNGFQYTNICFWYIPKSMQNQEETKAWWQQLYTVAPAIKERMVKRGSMMIGYSPLPSKNIGNFFRMTVTCFPTIKVDAIDFLINEIRRIGEEDGDSIWIHLIKYKRKFLYVLFLQVLHVHVL